MRDRKDHQLSPCVLLVIGSKENVFKVVKNNQSRFGNDSYLLRHEDRLALFLGSSNMTMTTRSNPDHDVILLGQMVSERDPYEDVLDNVVEAVGNQRYDELRHLQGVYALLIVDWSKSRVSLITDLMGIKPFYSTSWNDCTILSDRAEAAAKIFGQKIDPIGFGSWLYFGAPLEHRSIFEDVRRLPPASVNIWDASEMHQISYWSPVPDEREISQDDLIEVFYDEFSASLSRLLATHKSSTCLLSGGYDSRLAMLTALREGADDLKAVTVPYTRSERKIVDELVAETGIECRRIQINGSLWDAFDSIWFNHPDGFPVTRNLTYLCVKDPVYSQPFIDGSIASVSAWCRSAIPSEGPPENESVAREYVWRAHAKCCPEFCFNDKALNLFKGLAQQGGDELSNALGWDSKFCLKWDMYQDERRFTPINFLQYADIGLSVQPFFSRSLVENRLRHPDKLFNKDLYQKLLARYFPGPGELPHADDLAKRNDTVYAYSRSFQKLVPALIAFVHRNRHILNENWLVTRLLGYGMGRRRYLYIVIGVSRIMQMEMELQRLNVADNLSEFTFSL